MFHLNLQSWRDDPWIAEQRSAEQLQSMAIELGRYERATSPARSTGRFVSWCCRPIPTWSSRP